MCAQQTLFAPGCALREYKPELIDRMAAFLIEKGLVSGTFVTCCKADNAVQGPVTLITCCPGCDHMFHMRYPEVTTISLWKVLLDTDFPFPDYKHELMSIHDSCHSRGRNSSEKQAAVREICRRMNIDLAEPTCTMDETRCCGGCTADIDTRRNMARIRAEDFPADNVVVYCTGCTRSLSITRVHPRHILDLLYGETTEGLTLKV